jgi:D-alanyl-D-alanine dipeptidase
MHSERTRDRKYFAGEGKQMQRSLIRRIVREQSSSAPGVLMSDPKRWWHYTSAGGAYPPDRQTARSTLVQEGRFIDTDLAHLLP